MLIGAIGASVVLLPGCATTGLGGGPQEALQLVAGDFDRARGGAAGDLQRLPERPTGAAADPA
ncbi:hypothetical protein AB5I41_00845 [Sphingomonas sp. MMS24-JH45]